MNVYPNPSKYLIYIELENILASAYILSIYDVSGRLVLKKQLELGNTTYSVNISSLDAGIYFFNINNDKEMNGKIIVNK